MKHTIILLTTSFLFTTTLLGQSFNLTIKINNIKTLKGNIQIGVYNTGDDFLKNGREFKKVYVKVKDHDMSFTLNNLPQNNYAVAVFHDKNLDSVCNTNMLGMPIESYGFSKNYTPVFRAPKFDETSITMDSDKKILITLIDK